MLTGIDGLHILRDEYALTLRHTLRLDYKVDLCIFLGVQNNLISKLVHFIGKEPGFGEKFVVLRELPLHFFEIAGKVVFPSYLKHAREVIDSLMRFNLLKHLKCWSHIGPGHIPVGSLHPRVLLTDYTPTKDLLAHILNDIVLGIYTYGNEITCFTY